MVGDNGLPAMVESCIFQGERYLLELRLPDGQPLALVVECYTRANLGS